MKSFLIILVSLCALMPSHALAQSPTMNNAELVEKARQIAAKEQYQKELATKRLQHKDSVDYTIDDGMMTKEEMIQEAEYVYGLCARNSFQSLYFDCQCLSGGFLLERERLGAMEPQSLILQRLTQSNNAKCANIESMANESYKNCMAYSQSYRKFATDHEEICTCAANRSAKAFEKKPWLESSYIRSLNTAGLTYCLNPDNRAIDTAEKEALKNKAAQTVKTAPQQ